MNECLELSKNSNLKNGNVMDLPCLIIIHQHFIETKILISFVINFFIAKIVKKSIISLICPELRGAIMHEQDLKKSKCNRHGSLKLWPSFVTNYYTSALKL